jgi:hypothetical protein
VEQQSALSDALLRQLIAVGQVDILVGLPTLNNAATVVDVVRAVHLSFTRDFPRLRTVMINSDGGSTDGTPEVIRSASFAESDRVLTSHSLRTLHRVMAPYHGLPGKHTALRTVFAAGELTQAKVIVVVDPLGPTTSPERVTELVSPIARSEVEFLAPCHRRHPRDGVLVTQLVRPLVRALYGVGLDEPLGAEFSCSGRFASHCLEQNIWDQDVARFAIDLWVRTEAVAQAFTVGQIRRPAATVAGAHTRLREAVQQVVLALIESLRVHQSFWSHTNGMWSCPGGAPIRRTCPRRPGITRSLAQARTTSARSGRCSRRCSRRACSRASPRRPPIPSRIQTMSCGWRSSMRSWRRRAADGPASTSWPGCSVPLYLWRAAAFMTRAAHEDDATVRENIESLGETFQRLKPLLVERWSAEV